jgi:tetratricopeptide (TPR) repeat protein
MSSIFLVGLVAVVASVGWLRVKIALKKADEAQARTDANLMSAVEAFDGILENVTSRGLPRSLSEDVLSEGFEPMQSTSSEDDARLLDRLLEFYRKFAYANKSNTALGERTANAHRSAGTILVRLGRLTEASEDFETAIKLLSAIPEADRHSVATVVKVASIRNELGELYLRRGEFDHTLKSHLEARALLLSLPAKLRKDPSVRFELARATDLFASIDIRSGADQSPFKGPTDGPEGRHPPFETDTKTIRDPLSDLNDKPGGPSSEATSFDSGGPRPGGPPPDGPLPSGRTPRHGPPPHGGPAGPFFDGSLSENLKNAMPAAFASSPMQKDALEQTLLEACDEFRALVEENPDNPEYQFRFAQCLRHRLVHAAGKNDVQIVQDTFREAKEILERLRERFPEDPKYLFELAETLTQASRAEEDDQAIDSLDLAVSYAERLESHFPSVSEYQLLLGRALARRAAVEENVRSASDAIITLEKSIETLDRLTKQFPDQGVFQIPLAKTRQQLGDVLRRSVNTMIEGTEIPEKRLEKSLTVLQTAIKGFERYLAMSEDAANPQKKGHFDLQTRASLYSSLAETLMDLQRPDEAETARQNGRRPPGAKLDSPSQSGF